MGKGNNKTNGFPSNNEGIDKYRLTLSCPSSFWRQKLKLNQIVNKLTMNKQLKESRIYWLFFNCMLGHKNLQGKQTFKLHEIKQIEPMTSVPQRQNNHQQFQKKNNTKRNLFYCKCFELLNSANLNFFSNSFSLEFFEKNISHLFFFFIKQSKRKKTHRFV